MLAAREGYLTPVLIGPSAAVEAVIAANPALMPAFLDLLHETGALA